MTKQEAIETIKANYPPSNYMDLREALKIAIHCIEESEPINPIALSNNTYMCDNCGETIGWGKMNCGINMVKYKYCPDCGRKVKWE